MLSAFKARTFDFIPVPRKNSIYVKQKKKIIKKEEREENKFNIGTTNSMKDIMKNQSTSRKKINV